MTEGAGFRRSLIRAAVLSRTVCSALCAGLILGLPHRSCHLIHMPQTHTESVGTLVETKLPFWCLVPHGFSSDSPGERNKLSCLARAQITLEPLFTQKSRATPCRHGEL